MVAVLGFFINLTCMFVTWDTSPLTTFNYVKLHSESNPSIITKSQPMSELATLANIVDCFPM